MSTTESPTTDVEVFGSTAEAAVAERSHLPPAREVQALWKMAEVYARMPGLSKSYRDNQDAVMAALLTCWSLDLPTTPMIVNEFYAWESGGKTNLYPSTQILVALAAKNGVDLWFADDSDSTAATAYAQRRGDERVQRYTYTIDQARAANLTAKDNWKAAPDVMLRYRAARRLLKTAYPDTVLGIPRTVLDAEPIPAVSRTELEARAVAVEAGEEEDGEALFPVDSAPVVPLATDEQVADVLAVVALVPAERRRDLAERWKAAGIASVLATERFTADDAERALALVADVMAAPWEGGDE